MGESEASYQGAQKGRPGGGGAVEEGLLGDEVLVGVDNVLHVLFVHQGAVEVGVGRAGQVHSLIPLGQRFETLSKARRAVIGFLAAGGWGGGRGSLLAGAWVFAMLVTVQSPRSLMHSCFRPPLTWN